MKNYHHPLVPFRDIPTEDQDSHGGHSAYRIVLGLDEDQLRYALWLGLVFCFGNPECNATELIGKEWPRLRPAQDGHLLLAELGIGNLRPWAVQEMREKLAAHK